ASLKKNEIHFGNRISIKVVKNKVAPPFKKVELDLLFDRGICPELELLDAAIQYGIIEKAGAWLSYEGNNIAQGRDQAYQCLKNSAEMVEKIRAQVLEKIVDPRIVTV